MTVTVTVMEWGGEILLILIDKGLSRLNCASIQCEAGVILAAGGVLRCDPFHITEQHQGSRNSGD